MLSPQDLTWVAPHTPPTKGLRARPKTARFVATQTSKGKP
jgi:hypothetical protein